MAPSSSLVCITFNPASSNCLHQTKAPLTVISSFYGRSWCPTEMCIIYTLLVVGFFVGSFSFSYLAPIKCEMEAPSVQSMCHDEIECCAESWRSKWKKSVDVCIITAHYHQRPLQCVNVSTNNLNLHHQSFHRITYENDCRIWRQLGGKVVEWVISLEHLVCSRSLQSSKVVFGRLFVSLICTYRNRTITH